MLAEAVRFVLHCSLLVLAICLLVFQCYRVEVWRVTFESHHLALTWWGPAAESLLYSILVLLHGACGCLQQIAPYAAAGKQVYCELVVKWTLWYGYNLHFSVQKVRNAQMHAPVLSIMKQCFWLCCLHLHNATCNVDDIVSPCLLVSVIMSGTKMSRLHSVCICAQNHKYPVAIYYLRACKQTLFPSIMHRTPFQSTCFGMLLDNAWTVNNQMVRGPVSLLVL